MKYRHFQQLLHDNPDLLWLDQHIGPPQLRNYPCIHEPQRRQYVREVVKFIDFRDFAKLDLAAIVYCKKNIVLNGHMNPSRVETRYVIRVRIDGRNFGYDPIFAEMVPHHAFETPYEDLASPPTIEKKLGDRWMWSFVTGRHQSKPVVFEVIIKITRIWDGDWDVYSSETHEIYRFPPHLRRQAIWEKPPEQRTA